MKKEKLKRIARLITAFAAAAAMAATFTFPTEIGGGIFDGFGNAIVASAATQLDVTTGNVNITAPGDYIITGTSTTNTISVAAGVSANITLNGVNIDVSGTNDACAFRIADNSTGNVTITLADGSENTLKSGRECAGLQKNGMGQGIGKLTIKGGTNGTGKLTAYGSAYGAAIGGGHDGSSSNIEISGGAVNAVGVSRGAGIGGGYAGSCSDITISGGTVTAVCPDHVGIGSGMIFVGSVSCDNIVIKGGSVIATTSITPTNANGDEVFSLAIANPNSEEVRIDEANRTPVNHKALDSNDDNLYVFLTGEDHIVKIGNTVHTYEFDPNNKNFVETRDKDFQITATNSGETLVENTDYTYKYGILTILSDKAITISNITPETPAIDRIIVKKNKSPKITLDGVNIDVSAQSDICAFKIEDNSEGNVTIDLVGENTLKSGANCAGLQKNGAFISESKGKLTITSSSGTGKLTAISGDNGAGIGGGNNGSCSNIEIRSGTVTSTGGDNGAGIGGGYEGSASYITINDGTVNANGGYNGAGIGSGDSGSCSNIKISGGTVTATGGIWGAGIGGGNCGSSSKITISDSTVTATGGDYGAGIGGGYNGDGSNITISGGSVKAVAGRNANAIGGGSGKTSVAPTLGNTTPIYLLKIANPESKEVFIDSISYTTLNHKALDSSDGNLYVYLTGEEHTVRVGDTIYQYEFDAANNTFVETRAKTLKISATNSGETLAAGTDYTYTGGVLIISTDKAVTISNINQETPSIDSIFVEKNKSPIITLDGVDIDVSAQSDACAFIIEDNSEGNVTIDLKGENTLKSGVNCAGLQKNGNGDSIGKLTIQSESGTGTLIATGGDYGAGIGSSKYHSCSKIEITGGTVTATGGSHGAGIGGGAGTLGIRRSGFGSNITISGGTVTATGGYSGAGIGGGFGGDCSNIKISGGTVTATGGSNGAGIGGGYDGDCSNIKISDGTVTAKSRGGGAGIGKGENGASCSNIIITGASVKGSMSITPTLADGTSVYLLTIENPNSEEVIIDGSSYALKNHMALDSNDGNLYAYLPAKASINTPLKVKVGEKTTDYYCDTTKSAWVEIVAKPSAYSRTFTYDGTAKTYVVEANDAFYSISDNTTQTYAGEYQVTVSLNDTDKFIWNDGSYDDIVVDFVISKADPPAVKVPTATAITYGQALSASTLSDTNWSWVDGKVIPDVQNNGYPVKITVDDSNYDYTNVEGYNSSDHTVIRTIALTVNKAVPPAETVPTASAITYGQALSLSTLSDTNWSWVGGTVIPTVQNSGYPAKKNVDDSNYDYTNVEGYNSSDHTVTKTITVPVNKATPTITVTATPTSDIAGKTIAVSVKAVNPNNSTLTDVPAPTLSYKVGDNGTETAFTGSFVIPAGTADGTIITITAATAENGNYAAGANTAIVTVTDCKHTDKTKVWEKDSTGHWHICNYCGAVVDKAAHNEDSGTVTTEPTETSEGIKTYKCTVCGYVTRTETIAVLDHTHVPSDDYSKDETGHWHTCSGCTEKVDFEPHTEDSGTVTKEPTETTEGVKTYKCVKCGYVIRTEPIPALTPSDPINAFVDRLYTIILDRHAEAGGLADWTNRLKTGTATSAETVYGIIFSPEYGNKGLSNSEAIERLYRAMLGRDSDPAGKEYWLDNLAGGLTITGIINGFSGSQEFGQICASYGIKAGNITDCEPRDRNISLTGFVSRMYTKALGRNYDVDGLNDWTNRYLTGTATTADIAYGFIFSPEFQKKNLSDEDYVETLYETFFNRPSDAAGKADWLNRMHTQGYSREMVLGGFLEAPEFIALREEFGV